VLLLSLLLLQPYLFICLRFGFFFKYSAVPCRVLMFGFRQCSFVAASTSPTHELTVVPSVKSRFLFTLITCFRRTISLVIGRAPLALSSNKSCRELAKLTTGRFSKLGNILLTFLTDAASFTFAFLLKFSSAVSTFHNREVSTTFLAKLLSLTKLLKRVPGEALGAGVELALLPTHVPARLRKLDEK